jgi:hypothetical protein
MSAAARILDRVKPVNASVPIEYWHGDGPAIRAGLAALERVAILLDHAGLSDVAHERACNWISEVREALERFETPWRAAT